MQKDRSVVATALRLRLTCQGDSATNQATWVNAVDHGIAKVRIIS